MINGFCYLNLGLDDGAHIEWATLVARPLTVLNLLFVAGIEPAPLDSKGHWDGLLAFAAEHPNPGVRTDVARGRGAVHHHLLLEGPVVVPGAVEAQAVHNILIKCSHNQAQDLGNVYP